MGDCKVRVVHTYIDCHLATTNLLCFVGIDSVEELSLAFPFRGDEGLEKITHGMCPHTHAHSPPGPPPLPPPPHTCTRELIGYYACRNVWNNCPSTYTVEMAAGMSNFHFVLSLD